MPTANTADSTPKKRFLPSPSFGRASGSCEVLWSVGQQRDDRQRQERKRARAGAARPRLGRAVFLEILLELFGGEAQRRAAQPERFHQGRDAAHQRPSQFTAAQIGHRHFTDDERAALSPHDGGKTVRRAHHHAFDQRLTSDVRTGNAIRADNRGLVRHRPQYSAVVSAM